MLILTNKFPKTQEHRYTTQWFAFQDKVTQESMYRLRFLDHKSVDESANME